MVGVLIQIRHLDRVQRRHIAGHRRSGHARERDVAQLQCFDRAGFFAVELTAGIHFHFDAAFGPLFDQTSEFLIRQRGRVALGVNLAQLERRSTRSGDGQGHRGGDSKSKQLFHDGHPPFCFILHRTFFVPCG